MNFVTYNLILLAASLPALFIFSIGVMGLISPLSLFSKSERLPKGISLPILGLAGLYQIYFWGLWSAFIVALTYKYTIRPEVTWDWMYFVSGFMWCAALIGWLSHKERLSSESLKEDRGIVHGTFMYSTVALVAYVVFAIWPHLMLAPFGWALDLLGMTQYVAADPFVVVCPEPIPEFTLGYNSNPNEAEVQVLCDCIWANLNSEEKDIAHAVARGIGEVSELNLRRFSSRFGSVVEQCGGMDL